MDLKNCSSLLSANYIDRVRLYFLYVMKKQIFKMFLFSENVPFNKISTFRPVLEC